MKYTLFSTFFLFTLLVASCSTADAEKTAIDFHEKLDEKNYDYIIENLADLEGETTDQEWRDFFDIIESWGAQSNREKKSDFNKQYKNNVSTVKLSYTFELAEEGLIHERIVLIDRGGGYKILSVAMNPDEAVVEERTRNF